MLKVENLVVSYGGIEALKGISLDVPEGKIVTLIGANGAGKSTLLRSIIGLVKPAEGKITYEEKDITGLNSQKIVETGITLVPEGRRVFPNLTVLENLKIGAYLRNEKASSLPYGQQRHLEIVRALATNPKILLLDEPAAGMNPKETAELTEFIRQIRDEYNLTIFMIEHHMDLVMEISDWIYVLDFGMEIAQGTPADIQNNSRVIEAYLGVDEDA